ncbi:MAG: glycosyltransferase [Ardenticatenaceae bacterium]|nr:glycosyltransferase [Ardenticatenaceae bacterium]
MHILFLSRWFPYPTDNGSKLRIFNLLRGLARENEVSLIAFDDHGRADPHTAALQAICHSIEVLPWQEFPTVGLGKVKSWLSPTPRSHIETHSVGMARAIQTHLATRPVDLIIASQWSMASYHHFFSGLPAIFEEIELGIFQQKFTDAPTFPRRLRHGLTWTKQRLFLKRILPHFQAATVVSHREKELVQEICPAFQPVEVVKNCIELADYVLPAKEKNENSLVFTGSFGHRPNFEAMVWFIRDILPLIQQEEPDVCLAITGRDANLQLPPGKNVTHLGRVPDVRPVIASAAVSVVPLQTGGGTRLKILEAMALRTAVVTTTKGAEGLDAQHEKHLLIADTPEAFARSVLRLLRDSDLRHTLTCYGYRLVAEQYSWPVVLPKFLNLARAATSSRSQATMV